MQTTWQNYLNPLLYYYNLWAAASKANEADWGSQREHIETIGEDKEILWQEARAWGLSPQKRKDGKLGMKFVEPYKTIPASPKGVYHTQGWDSGRYFFT